MCERRVAWDGWGRWGWRCRFHQPSRTASQSHVAFGGGSSVPYVPYYGLTPRLYRGFTAGGIWRELCAQPGGPPFTCSYEAVKRFVRGLKVRQPTRV